MMKAARNKRGVALMLVLSAIVLLTTMGVEFAYNTNVSYHLAKNDLDRLRAYYLAKSAYSFMLLELKFDKTFRQVVQQQNLGQYLGANAQLPLCQQFPISTGLIRAVFTGGGLPGMGGEEGGETAGEEAEGGGEEGGGAELEEMRKRTSFGQESTAEEFLSFDGDFDGECSDEGTKIDLNSFAGLSAQAADGAVSPFDQYKQFLFRFLSRPQYENLFKTAEVRVADVVTNIGDWIDTNTEINPMGGGGGGVERAAYDRAGLPYQPRGGKLITLMEAYLIDGVVDDWFTPLMDQFTIYGDGKINVCTAGQDVVESLIRRYVDDTPSLPPLRLEDPEEMGRLLQAIYDTCATGATGDQLKSQLNAAINEAIGALSPGAEQPTQPAQQGSAGFASYVSTERRFFGLNLAGQVDDTTVRIQAVMDMKESDPKRWKLLYWRVH